jgi:hypothetical protein
MPSTYAPLTRCQTNPHYFAGTRGHPVMLAGPHMWNNLWKTFQAGTDLVLLLKKQGL